ncbi:MAG: hypothetical protein M1296_05260 [Chloroflexi bacterium]|nr:hypothetical protein [Chloroflexota bacterium]
MPTPASYATGPTARSGSGKDVCDLGDAPAPRRGTGRAPLPPHRFRSQPSPHSLAEIVTDLVPSPLAVLATVAAVGPCRPALQTLLPALMDAADLVVINAAS